MPESMTTFTLSPYLRRRLRTTNSQERLNRETLRRTPSRIRPYRQFSGRFAGNGERASRGDGDYCAPR